MLNLLKICFALNAPKSYLGLSTDQNVENLHIQGVKNAHFGGQKCQNLQKMLFCSKCPPNSCREFILPQMPQKVICGSLLMTKICNISIFGGSKMPIWGVKMPKFANKMCFLPAFFCFATHSNKEHFSIQNTIFTTATGLSKMVKGHHCPQKK